MKMIEVNNVSMRFNMAKEKHESLKEYFVALLHGGIRRTLLKFQAGGGTVALPKD